MNILDPVFNRTLFYDFRQWTPRAWTLSIILRILDSSPFSFKNMPKYQKCRQHVIPPSPKTCIVTKIAPSNSIVSLLLFVNKNLQNIPTTINSGADICWSHLQPFFEQPEKIWNPCVTSFLCEHACTVHRSLCPREIGLSSCSCLCSCPSFPRNTSKKLDSSTPAISSLDFHGLISMV